MNTRSLAVGFSFFLIFVFLIFSGCCCKLEPSMFGLNQDRFGEYPVPVPGTNDSVWAGNTTASGHEGQNSGSGTGSDTQNTKPVTQPADSDLPPSLPE